MSCGEAVGAQFKQHKHCGFEDQMKLDRIFNFVLVAAIATSFSFLLCPVEVTAIASDNSRTTRDETMRAFTQISELVSSQIVPEKQLNQSAPATSMELSNNATTTAAPYVLTQEELLRVLRRNLRGLARLFNMESRKAIEDSNNNVRILRKEFMDAVRPYFARNTTT